jgi:hypothetical protein
MQSVMKPKSELPNYELINHQNSNKYWFLFLSSLWLCWRKRNKIDYTNLLKEYDFNMHFREIGKGEQVWAKIKRKKGILAFVKDRHHQGKMFRK